MRTWMLCELALLIVVAAGQAAEPAAVVEDVWEAAQLEGGRVGFVHTSVRGVEGAGDRRLRATQELELNFRRRNAVMQLRVEHGTEETPDGRVLGVFMKQFHGGGQQLTLTGTVEKGQLHYVVDQGRIDRRVWWSDQVVGLYGQERLFRTRKLKPGDTFTFLSYEPTVAAVVTRRARAIGVEEVTTAAGRHRLLRVEETPDKLPGTNVRLARSVYWLDEEGVAQRRQIELDGLGLLDLIRTSRARANATAGRGTESTAFHELPDIGLKSLVPLNRAVARPQARPVAIYRITVRGESDAAGAFVQDAHQEVRAARGDTFELVVHPLREPRRADATPFAGEAPRRAPVPPGPEFLSSSYYIDCDDQHLKDLARQAVGIETDPWRAALCIEGWVNRNLRPDDGAAMVPASQAARTRRGDCRHYALLSAALCRAEAIPARTAVGLLQVERGGRPYLGFHLWTEVCVDGHWRGLDATLGRQGVGASHIKVADHSWHDTRSLTPFLPVQRLLGKMTVSVVD